MDFPGNETPLGSEPLKSFAANNIIVGGYTKCHYVVDYVKGNADDRHSDICSQHVRELKYLCTEDKTNNLNVCINSGVELTKKCTNTCIWNSGTDARNQSNDRVKRKVPYISFDDAFNISKLDHQNHSQSSEFL